MCNVYNYIYVCVCVHYIYIYKMSKITFFFFRTAVLTEAGQNVSSESFSAFISSINGR